MPYNSDMDDCVTESVLGTISFHDTLDFPLTAWEVFQYAIAPEKIHALAKKEVKIAPSAAGIEKAVPFNMPLAATMDALQKLTHLGIIGQYNGYYFLAGRSELYTLRIEQMKIAEEKWHKARRVLSFLRTSPFVRASALAGSLGRACAPISSDVDLLIICAAGRIWTTRFFLTLFAALTWRLRPGMRTKYLFPFVRKGQGGSVADKLCLNHYISEDGLALSCQTLYTALMNARIIPLWGKPYFEDFYSNNDWIRHYLPNAIFCAENKKSFGDSGAYRKIQKLMEFALSGWIGDMVEKILGWAQKKLIENNPLTRLPGLIITGSDELAFHPNKRDEEITALFEKKMRFLEKITSVPESML